MFLLDFCVTSRIVSFMINWIKWQLRRHNPSVTFTPGVAHRPSLDHTQRHWDARPRKIIVVFRNRHLLRAASCQKQKHSSWFLEVVIPPSRCLIRNDLLFSCVPGMFITRLPDGEYCDLVSSCLKVQLVQFHIYPGGACGWWDGGSEGERLIQYNWL